MFPKLNSQSEFSHVIQPASFLRFGVSERLRFNMVQTSQVKDGPEIHCGQLEPYLQHTLLVNTLLWTEGCGLCGQMWSCTAFHFRDHG